MLFWGGLETLKKAEEMRAHDSPFISVGYFKYFMSLILPSSIFYYILQRKNKKFLILFSFSFILSIYFLLVNAGRAPILMYLIFFVLFNLETKSNSFGLVSLIIPLIGGILFAVYGNDFLSFILTRKLSFSNINLYEKFLKFISQLSNSYTNLLKAPDYLVEKENYMFFKEFFTWPISILPGENKILKLLNINSLYTTTDLNTQNFNYPETTGKPVDFLSFGYYQLSYLGVIINSIIFGYIIKKIDLLFKFERQEFIVAIKIWTIFFIFGLINYIEIPTNIRSKMHYWLPLLFYIVFRKISIIIKKN